MIMPIVKPTGQKQCPFFKTACKGAECALFLSGCGVCAITFNAVCTGNILGIAEGNK
jgi:hypothetical protein